MKRKIVLYPVFEEKGLDLSKEPKVVVPNQSMTLRDIIKRFVKKESLPAQKEGIYHESEYDLEKLSKADLTEQHEVIEELKQKVKRKKKVVDDYHEEQKKKEEEQRAKGSQAPEAPKA